MIIFSIDYSFYEKNYEYNDEWFDGEKSKKKNIIYRFHTKNILSLNR